MGLDRDRLALAADLRREVDRRELDARAAQWDAVHLCSHAGARVLFFVRAASTEAERRPAQL